MAGSLALNVEILGEFRNLTAATRGATSQLTSLSKTATKISGGMRKAFGAIGVGFSLNLLKNELGEAAKAAIADAKSMNILALAMENTGKATGNQVAQAEESIRKMSLQAAVADDALRPAFQKLFIATGDVTASNRYLQIALDASAATGKDLDSVTQAMAKSLAGQDTALLKLIPSLRGAQDPLAELEKTFKGAAEEAAKTDPFQRLNVIFGEIKESIGIALLPMLNNLADWFITVLPDIQNFFKIFTEALDTPQVRTSVGKMSDSLGRLGDSIASLFGSTDTDEAKGFVNFWTILSSIVKQLADGLNYIVSVMAALTGNTKPIETILTPYLQGALEGLGYEFLPTIPNQPGRSNESRTNNQNVTINVNNGNVTAQQIANAINRGNRTTGTNLIRNFE
jgi:hypothetical protein